MKGAELEWIVNIINIQAPNRTTEEIVQGYARLLCYGEEDRYPQTREGAVLAYTDVLHIIERCKQALRKLPKEVLGEDVEWGKVCFGYLTAEQKENLRKYCEEKV